MTAHDRVISQIVWLTYHKVKLKRRSFSWLWNHWALAVELISDQTTNVEAESNALGIDCFCLFKASEHLEEVLLVVKGYSNSIVNDTHFEHAKLSYGLVEINFNGNLASLRGELKCVALEIKEDLLESSFIGTKNVVDFFQSFEVARELDAEHVCFLLLHEHHLFDCTLDVHIWTLLSELPCIDLRKVKQIVYKTKQELGWSVNDLHSHLDIFS